MKNLLFTLFLLFVLFGFSQQTEYVDFKASKADIVFKNMIKKEIEGLITYEFEILKDIDSIFIDARNFTSIKYKLDNKYEDSLYNNNQLIVKHHFKANSVHKIDVVWKTIPKKAMYFIDWEYENGNKQVWTQGQGKYTSNWLPSFDDMNEKVKFDLSITFEKDYKVIANGKLADIQINDSLTTWHYTMQKPMSSYLLALAIGKYNKKVEYSKSGIPLEMYYYPEDSLKVEPTYRYTKHMFDFLEEEIGVSYPWQNYKQIPVKDFLYAGMENTSTTIFSDAFVTDSIGYVDKNYVNVNAHELAHQWFGDLVTETSGTHHWLQEGFATYYALLAEKEVFGEDYYYWRLYEYAQELQAQNQSGDGTSLLNPKSSSITFYKKGAWVLHLLRERIGGKAFKVAVKEYLLKHQFENVETNDFITEVEKASGKNLNDFISKWLISDKFYYNDCLSNLTDNSKELQEFLKLNQDFIQSSKKLSISLNEYYEKASSYKIKLQIFSKENGDSISNSIYKRALNSKDLKLRQAVAKSISRIPRVLKADYETLLNDKSYITIEVALFNLWNNFTEDQNKYLNKTKGIIGFNDKNIRILWLTLALISDDFEPENNQLYFNELEDYTSPKYGFEIRQNAFGYLKYISSCAGVCEENLKQATKHHNWRFSKFAKTLLKAK